MNKRISALIGALLAISLAACGLKGPLYLPDAAEPAVEPEPEPESEERDETAA
jgi:predicted small lipoprotein YifL